MKKGNPIYIFFFFFAGTFAVYLLQYFVVDAHSKNASICDVSIRSYDDYPLVRLMVP